MKTIAVAFLAFSLLTLPLPTTAGGPEAEHPTWTEGSTWRYEGTAQGKPSFMTDTVMGTEAVDGKTMYVVRRGATTAYFDLNLNLAMRKNSRGQVVMRADPPLGYFRWPLRVGDRWSQKVVHLIDGTTYRYEQDFKILAYEKVKTPAGEFDAFKLSRAVVDGVTYEEYWYAPAVKNIVKMVGTSGTGGDFERALASYDSK